MPAEIWQRDSRDTIQNEVTNENGKKKTVRLGKTILQTQISTFFGAPTENVTKIVGGNIFFLISSTISTLFFHRKVYNVFFHTRRSLSNISFKKNMHGKKLARVLFVDHCFVVFWCSLSEPDTSKHTIWKQTGADETNLCQKIFLLSWFEATPKKTKGMSYWVLLFSVASSAVHAPARRVSESIILELFCVFRAWLHSHVTCRLSIN